MKSSFPGFFANGAIEISKLWQECLFVLDANVLLSLYRFSDSTRIELLKVFASLRQRLWIPHQVASEYLANRLTVLGEQLKAYDDAVKKVESLQKSLENLNQAPFVSGGTQREAAKVFRKLIDEFAEKRSVHDQRVYSDDIKDALEELFSGRVGKPFSRQQLEDCIKVGAERYAENIPPGYEDRKKGGDSELFSDRCKPYGDYFVWLQMIEKSKKDGVSIIFITGDVKDDWWSSFQGKTIGPLPALVEEFQQLTGKNFYMYTPHRFLERANEHLKQDVPQVAVDEIKNSERHDEIRHHSWDSRLHNNKFSNRDVGPVEQMMRERQELVNKGVALKQENLKTVFKKSELLSLKEKLIPGFDDHQIKMLDEEIRYLDLQSNHQLAEIDYTRIMLAEIVRRLTEMKPDTVREDK